MTPAATPEALDATATKALAEELFTYANQLTRMETQAGFGGTDLSVRVKEPGWLAALMRQAGSALQARRLAATEAALATATAEAASLRAEVEHEKALRERAQSQCRDWCKDRDDALERLIIAVEERDALRAEVGAEREAHAVSARERNLFASEAVSLRGDLEAIASMAACWRDTGPLQTPMPFALDRAVKLARTALARAATAGEGRSDG